MVFKVEKLVVDANAFIKAYPLQEFASTIYTVPDVIKEIRDSATRNALQCTVYDLVQKEPTADSVKRATEYSKSTGDYQSLSLVDIKLIALSIELFEEFNEKKIEFKEAKIRSVVGSGLTAEERAKNPDAAKPGENTSLPIGFHTPKVNLEKHDVHFKIYPYVAQHSYTSQDEALYERIMEIGGISAVGAQFPYLRRWLAHIEKLIESGCPQADQEEDSDSEDEEILAETDESDSDYDSHENENEGQSEEEEDEDDDEGWITPSNYKRKVAAEAQVSATPSAVRVLSTDFAIQNVILHTNVPLISPYGQQITTLRSYILRCYTCFHTTSQFEKQFCPRCGNKTLRRISVSIDENGQMKLHFSKKYTLTPKGKKFSLPKPQGGKHAVNPILSEDQHTTPNYRSKKAVAREIGPFSLNDVSTRSFVVKKGQNVCYWNSKNPNATRPKGGRK